MLIGIPLAITLVFCFGFVSIHPGRENPAISASANTTDSDDVAPLPPMSMSAATVQTLTSTSEDTTTADSNNNTTGSTPTPTSAAAPTATPQAAIATTGAVQNSKQTTTSKISIQERVKKATSR